METTLREIVMTETYLDINPLINSIAIRFFKTYGGGLDEWKAQANLLFVMAYDSYNETKGIFSTWVYFRIEKGLQDFVKKNRNQKNAISQIKDHCKETTPRSSSFSVFEFVDEISEDARTIANLIWHPSTEFQTLPKANGNHGSRMRTVLESHLKSLGWTRRRVKESFEEIRRVLYEFN